MSWNIGDRLRHRFNPELGPGLVSDIEGRTVIVTFPDNGTVLRLAATSDAIQPLELREGMRALLISTGESVIVEAVDENGVTLTDNRVVEERDVWPIDVADSLTERLAQGSISKLENFALRLDSLHLAGLREADGLGSFLGGRIRIFPHQLYAAERATRTDPVRWLLADEVGLGKTVEACLILNHLLRTGRADRTLVVTPDTLTVQWLGELWRKYHQVFVLMDEKRLVDVEKVYGEGFNPFEAHRNVVISIEMLVEKPYLTEAAVEAGIDMLIVDEAHHLHRPPGHPGDPKYRAIAPIAATGRHVLLLTATPLEDDAHGFFRLLQLLRPDEFPEEISIDERLAGGEPLPPCTSATRRQDIGGLPPRAPEAVALDAEEWAPIAKLEAAMRALPADNAVAARKKARRIRRALASGDALDALLDRQKERPARALAKKAMADDPRIGWLVESARRWRADGDKTLVFVAHRESLEAIRDAMSRGAQLRVGVFHEDLSPGQRDIEVAQFRTAAGPSMLISTECGGEGRNFEFCTRLILFDLPWDPMLVEQRIGRLDRIGRDRPVEIRYFKPPSGIGAAVVDLYESLGLFRHPLGGLGRELAAVEAAVEELALSDADINDASHFQAIVEGAREAYDRVESAAYHELHRDPYVSAMEAEILSRIPGDLDEQVEEVVLATCEQLSLKVEPHRGAARHSVELGTHARVESLPGVVGGSSFLGTFDREEAVADESIDFYASGHPLVEGILAHLEDSHRGRVALLHLKAETEGENAFGLLAIYKDGPTFEGVAIDITGKERPELAERLTRRPLRSRRVPRDSWTRQPGWPKLIRSLARKLEERGRPVAVAAFRIGD